MFLTVFSALLLALALVQCAIALRVRRHIPTVDSLPDPQGERRWPLISVIVPAKDEGEHIESALGSKLSCGYPSLEIVVVDDRSTDETPAILQRLAKSHPELTAARVDALPDGWLGKLHAMHKGLSAARGEWVLFADADVHIERGTIERLIAYAERERIDFMGVFPKMEPVSLVVDSSLAGLLRALALGGRLWKMNDDASGIGGGVGAFNLAKREWLERTGAVEHLRMEIADDVALGAYLKQCGARTRMFAGRERVSLVFQTSLAGLQKSADKGGGMFGWVLWRPVLVALTPIAIELALPSMALARGGLAALFASLAWLFITVAHYLFSSHFEGPVRGALLWPIGHFVNAATMLRAGWLAWKRQGVVWRGTFYSRAVVDEGRRIDTSTMRVKPRA
ncbi:MAG: glycosyltransferase family 2 protein [Polyangiales bacterium]